MREFVVVESVVVYFFFFFSSRRRHTRCLSDRSSDVCSSDLGAGPLRLLKQVLTESVLLALVGAIVGLLLAVWGVDLLKHIGASTVPRLREVNLDLHVLAITFAIAVGTGILFGLVPGLAWTKPELTESLKEGGRGSTQGRRGNRLRSALIIV